METDSVPALQTVPEIQNYTIPVKYRVYASYDRRHASFTDWPQNLPGPLTTDLARSGFIYTRVGDRVTCFSCGVILKNWEQKDDAYSEHVFWSPGCKYAKLVGRI